MRTYSRIFRTMHWAIAFCLIFILVTIFLRLYWMEKNHVADIISAELVKKGYNIERPELIALAKKIRKPMWDWHIYAGYVLVGLYAIRMILPFRRSMKFLNPLNANTVKDKLRAWSYIVFYAFVGMSLATGLVIEWGPSEWKKPIESLHVLSLYYLIPFIILHFTGLFLAEKTAEKGVVSRMIRGDRKPADSQATS